MSEKEKNKEIAKQKYNKGIWVVGGFLLLIILGYFLFFNEKEILSLGVYRGEFSSLIFIADEMGYFSDEGLNVDMTLYDNGVDPLKKVISKEHDISTCGEFVAVSHSFDNPNLRILSVIDVADAIELVVRKDAGISILGDLEGKNIGLKKKSQAEYFMGLMMESINLGIENVNVVDVNPSDMQEKIDDGEIDGVMVWDPFAYDLKQNFGNDIEWWKGQSGQKFYFLLMSREGVVSDKQEEIEAFLRALIKAEEYVKENERESVEIVQKFLKYEDERYIDAVWEKSDFRVFLNNDLIDVLKEEGQWAMDNGITASSEVPEYEDYIRRGILGKIDSSRVEI